LLVHAVRDGVALLARLDGFVPAHHGALRVVIVVAVGGTAAITRHAAGLFVVVDALGRARAGVDQSSNLTADVLAIAGARRQRIAGLVAFLHFVPARNSAVIVIDGIAGRRRWRAAAVVVHTRRLGWQLDTMGGALLRRSLEHEMSAPARRAALRTRLRRIA